MITNETIIVFGQRDYTNRLRKYFARLLPATSAVIFEFATDSANPAERTFDFSRYDERLHDYPPNTEVIVAFGAKDKFAAKEHLEGLGFTDIRLFDAALDNKLKKEFFKADFAAKDKPFFLIDEQKSVAVYMAKSVTDKQSDESCDKLSPHVVPIQVGAALTDKRIANVTDDTGDNISARNRHYSETTALYWIWKNATADYLGVCHYRRLWKNLDVICERLQREDTDVVLPLPSLMPGSVLEGHLKYYTPDVWETMLTVLKEKCPEYYEASKTIYAGDIFYASNMFIAKRKVLDGLCEFMFPIVMEVENRIGDLPNAYYNRYAGFCTEQLITLYFLYNKQNWRIAHAEKIFVG